MTNAVVASVALGAESSREPGKVIELKDGQEFNEANIALQRGGAITGRVVDDSGDPLSRPNVYASRQFPGSSTFQRTGGGLNHRYYAVAVPARSFGMSPETSSEFFETLARDATRVVVAQDERRVVDLRVTRLPE